MIFPSAGATTCPLRSAAPSDPTWVGFPSDKLEGVTEGWAAVDSDAFLSQINAQKFLRPMRISESSVSPG